MAGDLTAALTGTATVTSSLDVITKLDAALTGTATVTSAMTAVGRVNDVWLYLLGNVGVGFRPTDDDSTSAGFVSQTYPDGWVSEYDDWLYLLGNVGVGFRPTDDASTNDGFVSQTYPDGWVSEYDDWLYLLANVIVDLRRPGFRFFHMTVSSRPRPFRPPSPKTWS